MDISGLWKYDDLKKQYNAVAAELDTVKKTATQLTHENNDLKIEFDKLDDAYTADYERLLGEVQKYRGATIKAGWELNKAKARIKELEAKASEPKWGYHEMLTADGIRIVGWIPIEGTAYQILSKTPAMFPQFCKEKQVPEK